MSAPHQSTIQNKLLALLPAADFDQVAPDFHHVVLPRGRPLAQAGKPIEHGLLPDIWHWISRRNDTGRASCRSGSFRL
jgi:hypothetical protein